MGIGFKEWLIREGKWQPPKAKVRTHEEQDAHERLKVLVREQFKTAFRFTHENDFHNS